MKKGKPEKETRPTGYGKDIPPAAGHVRIYLEQKGFTLQETEDFLETMLRRGWKTQTGRPVQNWKQYAFEWQHILRHTHPESKRKKTSATGKPPK